MEDFLITIIVLLALFYLYKKLFRSSGCGCGTKNCNNKNK